MLVRGHWAQDSVGGPGSAPSRSYPCILCPRGLSPGKLTDGLRCAALLLLVPGASGPTGALMSVGATTEP